MQLFVINRSFLPLKLIYFFFYASAAALMAFKSIFQKSLGMSAAQNGIIQSTERFLILCFPPLIGALADVYSQHRRLLTACLFAFSVLLIPGYAIPSINITLCQSEYQSIKSANQDNITCDFTADNKLQCFSQVRNLVSCSNLTSLEDLSEMKFEISSLGGCTSNISLLCHDGTSGMVTLNGDIYGVTFFLLMVFTIIYAVVSSSIGPLLDSTTFQVIGAKNNEQNFGQQRMYGSIGFGVGALATGYLVDFYTELIGASSKNYLFVFVVMGVLGIVATVISFWVKVPHHHVTSIIPGLKLIFTSVDIALFVWISLVHGIVQSVKYSYLFWFGESLQGGNPTTFGFAVLSDCLSEVPMFFVSNWFIKRIGHKPLLFFGLVIASVRTFFYAFLTHAWQMILLEAINGFAFALPMAAMCSYVYKLAPDGMTTILMSLVQGVYWGLANVFGNLLGGFVLDSYGAKVLFKATSVFGMVGAFFYAIASFMHQKLSTSVPLPDHRELKGSEETDKLHQQDNKNGKVVDGSGEVAV